MTTYILGAGASRHAGYPLTAELWSRLAIFAKDASANYASAVATVSALQGPVSDIETVLTLLDRGKEPFNGLTAEERSSALARIMGGVAEMFRAIRLKSRAKDYQRFSDLLKPGDVLITFNYDIALDAALAQAGRFRAPLDSFSVPRPKIRMGIERLRAASGG